MAQLTNQFPRTRHITSSPDKHYSLDSEDVFRSGCRNVSHQQQFFSELPSPGRSHYTNYWYSRVQAIYNETRLCQALSGQINTPVVINKSAITLLKWAILPRKFENIFTINNQIHRYNTRHENSFRLPLRRTNIRQFSVFFQGPKFFNSLSPEISGSSSLTSLKKKLKAYIIDNY